MKMESKKIIFIALAVVLTLVFGGVAGYVIGHDDGMKANQKNIYATAYELGYIECRDKFIGDEELIKNAKGVFSVLEDYYGGEISILQASLRVDVFAKSYKDIEVKKIYTTKDMITINLKMANAATMLLAQYDVGADRAKYENDLYNAFETLSQVLTLID